MYIFIKARLERLWRRSDGEEGGEGREIDFGTIASIRTNTQGVAEKEREREARRVNFDVLSDPFEIAVTNPCRRGPRFAYG